MKWKDVQSALKKVAPAAATAIGGPVAGVVTQAVANALGVEHAPSAVAQALANDPDAAVKLAGIEAEVTQAAIADVQHARQFAPDDGVRRWLAILLPITAVTFGGVFVAFLIWKGQITEAVGMAGMVLGWLIRDASASTSFYFGTSLGSKKKSEEISQLTSGSGN